MPRDIERRRVLAAAQPCHAEQLRHLFAQTALQDWHLLEADGLEKARFLLQQEHFDILLVDEGLYHAAGSAGLGWLTRHAEGPTVLLNGLEPNAMATAFEQGVSLCLPRQLVLDYPHVLAAGLSRVAAFGQLQHGLRRSADRLHKCRRQVDRLVNMLWRNVPMDPERHWFTHRHVLERLQEEVARCGRHGNVLTVAVGEVEQVSAQEQEAGDLAEWMTAAVARAKRRCDVAGYYGLHGFLLLMVHTPAEGGVTCCRRLQTHLEAAAQKSQGPGGPIRARFGLSSFAPDWATAVRLLVRAEKHLEAAKAGTGGGVVGD